MSDPFDLPPDSERYSRKQDRLAFKAEPDGTRRLTRIAQVAHVEQILAVSADQPYRLVVLRQRYAERMIMPEDRAWIGMDPDEARHIAACLVAAADEIDAAGTGGVA